MESRLAAIRAVDLAGYSALMKRDEVWRSENEYSV
jgi:hypothetical protein